MMKISNNFKKLEDRLRRIDGAPSVELSKLFNPEFMRSHTSHSSFAAFVEASPFKVSIEEEFNAIPDAEWDKYVQSSTRFNSWAEMQKRAAAEWVKQELDLTR